MKTNHKFPRSSGSVISSLTLSAFCTLAVLTACQPKARNQDQPAAAAPAADKPAGSPAPAPSGDPAVTDAELAGAEHDNVSAPPAAKPVTPDAAPGTGIESEDKNEGVAENAKPAQQAKVDQPAAANAAVPAPQRTETAAPEAASCLVQLFQTELPLPDEVFEKTKGKALCLEDYFAAKQVHRFSFDFDRMKVFEDQKELKSYDGMLFHVASSSPLASKKLNEQDRAELARGVWASLLASMKIEAAPCAIEFKDGETVLKLEATKPIERIDPATENPGTRLMIKSEDFKSPSWKLTCPSFTKQGKYFFVFVDAYENAKAGDKKNPDRMIKYLFSAH